MYPDNLLSLGFRAPPLSSRRLLLRSQYNAALSFSPQLRFKRPPPFCALVMQPLTRLYQWRPASIRSPFFEFFFRTFGDDFFPLLVRRLLQTARNPLFYHVEASLVASPRHDGIERRCSIGQSKVPPPTHQPPPPPPPPPSSLTTFRNCPHFYVAGIE